MCRWQYFSDREAIGNYTEELSIDRVDRHLRNAKNSLGRPPRALSRLHLDGLRRPLACGGSPSSARGQPSHVRGVTPISGVYFLGLLRLHTWGSGRFSGVARDAEYLAEHIKAHIGLSGSDKRD